MTETGARATLVEDPASVAVRARIAAVVRQDLADEAAAGFPLLRRFPNMTTAGIPDYYLGMSPTDRETLLDALVYYSVVREITPWRLREEQKAHPVFGPFIRRQSTYPPGDWYGERPRKSAIRKLAKQKFLDAGYVQLKLTPFLTSTHLGFSNPDATFQGRLLLSFDPSGIAQLDFGFRDWLHADLLKHFEPQSPRDSTPIVNCLAYDHLWHGLGRNDCGCWDVITEANLDQSVTLMVEASHRLVALATRINELAVPGSAC